MKRITLLFAFVAMLFTSCDFQPEWKLDKTRFPVVKSFVSPQTGDSVHIFKDDSYYYYGRLGVAIGDSIIINAKYTEIQQFGNLLIATHPGYKDMNGWDDLYDLQGNVVDVLCRKIETFEECDYLLLYENNHLEYLVDKNGKKTYIFSIRHEATKVLSIKKGVVIYTDGDLILAQDLTGKSLNVFGFLQKNGDTLEMPDLTTPVLIGKSVTIYGTFYVIYYLRGDKWLKIDDVKKINNITEHQIRYTDYSGKKQILVL